MKEAIIFFLTHTAPILLLFSTDSNLKTSLSSDNSSCMHKPKPPFETRFVPCKAKQIKQTAACYLCSRLLPLTTAAESARALRLVNTSISNEDMGNVGMFVF